MVLKNRQVYELIASHLDLCLFLSSAFIDSLRIRIHNDRLSVRRETKKKNVFASIQSPFRHLQSVICAPTILHIAEHRGTGICARIYALRNQM